MLYIVQNSTQEEYERIIFPTLKYVRHGRTRESESGNKREIDVFLISTPSLSFSLSLLRPLFTNRKSIQGTVTLLENLHVILQKTPQEYEREVLSMLYTSFENSTIQVRVSFKRVMPELEEWRENSISEDVFKVHTLHNPMSSQYFTCRNVKKFFKFYRIRKIFSLSLSNVPII